MPTTRIMTFEQYDIKRTQNCFQCKYCKNGWRNGIGSLPHLVPCSVCNSDGYIANRKYSDTRPNRDVEERKMSMDNTENSQPPTIPPVSAFRLWRVAVEYELLVLADSERQALSEARYYAGEDGSSPSCTIATEVHQIKDVPTDWQDSFPFGGDPKDERTCRELLTPLPTLESPEPIAGQSFFAVPGSASEDAALNELGLAAIAYADAYRKDPKCSSFFEWSNAWNRLESAAIAWAKTP